VKRLKECDDRKLDELLTRPDPLLLHFGTDWCTPCKRLERVLLGVHESLPARLAKINVEDHPDIAIAFSVTKNPTLCLFEGGDLIARHEGYLPSEGVLAFVRGHVSSSSLNEDV
jgi:thioredoxin 1